MTVALAANFGDQERARQNRTRRKNRKGLILDRNAERTSLQKRGGKFVQSLSKPTLPNLTNEVFVRGVRSEIGLQWARLLLFIRS